MKNLYTYNKNKKGQELLNIRTGHIYCAGVLGKISGRKFGQQKEKNDSVSTK